MSRIDWHKGKVDMTHGSGGRAMHQLIQQLFAAEFDNEYLRQGNDGAILPALAPGERLVMATDAHVISPLFFPGGDIGSLSIHGTVNDVAMNGARPLYIAVAFILEEGLPLADLKRIVQSMAKAAEQAGVAIVTGDTKVVEKGSGDGVFITTTGVGVVPEGVNLSGAQVQVGDHILISGSMGDHGIAILSQRESLGFETELVSDSQALNVLVTDIVGVSPELRCLRDPTRGGLANTLNELAQQSGVGMLINEAQIPVKPQVAAACEFLGLDPLYVANEGKLIAICPPQQSQAVLAAMQQHSKGRDAAIIGEVIQDPNHFVQMTTRFGGRRMVDWLNGEQLPRIC